MRKSLMVTHISNCDYPIWRQWLERYHSWFDEIIVCWDLSFRFPIFSSFIQQSLSHLPNIKFIDPVERDFATEDWRNKATNEMLKHATGDWIISIEQDWFAKDWDKLLKDMEEIMQNPQFGLSGWMNPTNFSYIHPAFLFIRRDILEKTNKDFAPHPEINGCDHFAMITHDVRKINPSVIWSINNMEFFETNIINPEKTDCFHLGGVNQNYLDFKARLKSNTIHREEIFYVYNYWSMKANVPQNDKFLEIYREVNETLKVRHPEIDPEIDGWNQFFK